MSREITRKSKIKEIYATPVGHDVLFKVLMQLGKSESLILNPIVGNLRLSTLEVVAKKWLGTGFVDTFIELVNSEQDEPGESPEEITPAWWKEAVFYQIYPRSFMDANGDGIGDLRGIIDKLDYLKELGVDALWLSPIYDSPNDDNGYDIRDYHKIMQEFGTMEDFEELLDKVHKKGMKLIMDLVVNHTSDEHAWFQEALQNPDSKYRKYYFMEDDKIGDIPPNNWTSFFSGPAWNYYKEQKTWAMHLFSKKQMDLNWDNEEVREDVIKMINWWLDKGVDGFRMDVINYISKKQGLPMGDKMIGDMMGFTGIEHYYYGPNLHKYLREIREKAFEPHGAFSVGETPGIGMKMCQLVTGEERKELDMVFSFDQLETPGHVRFDDYEYDLNYYRDYMVDWMTNYGNQCWMSVFYNNHDNPRMISKITKDAQYHTQLAILLAVMQFTLKGTPFVFQGDEMGLANYEFKSMNEITDVEAKGYYEEQLRKVGAQEAFAQILAGTREHTRVLLPWNDCVEKYPEHLKQKPKQEVYEAYKELIAIRKHAKGLVYGEFSLLDGQQGRFVYQRKYGDEKYIIDCNLSNTHQQAYSIPEDYELLYPGGVNAEELAPYEARIWALK